MLVELHREIDTRTREIAASQTAWPCRRGCDTCCRRLAELPRLPRAEWSLVEDGLARLPRPLQLEIAGRIREIKSSGEQRVCPFLDRDAGSCLIYEHRPVACRTYGFYVERERGLYCGKIEARVEAGEFSDVVWGNAAAIEARLEACGEKIPLLAWFNDSPESSPRLLPTPPSASPDPCGAPSPSRSARPSVPR
jgi:Fe-S-cluster containining protein